MIHGTAIKLLTLEGAGLIEEVVNDVLIGEPAGSTPNDQPDGSIYGYTLGIPKGDIHTWTDRLVEFWGLHFRTVGYPQKGISENIPLRWGQNVKVKLADISGSCTIYEVSTYIKHDYSYVCVEDTRGGTIITSDGSRKSGTLTIRLYSMLRTDRYIPKVGDIVVPGTCEIVFDTTSEARISESMAALRAQAPGYAAIKSLKHEHYGSAPDLLIEAR